MLSNKGNVVRVLLTVQCSQSSYTKTNVSLFRSHAKQLQRTTVHRYFEVTRVFVSFNHSTFQRFGFFFFFYKLFAYFIIELLLPIQVLNFALLIFPLFIHIQYSFCDYTDSFYFLQLSGDQFVTNTRASFQKKNLKTKKKSTMN